VVPQVVDLLEALRTADVADTAGYGGWDRSGQAAQPGWAAWLLLANYDDPTERTHGWRERLATSAHGDAGFQWGMARLEALASDDVPRCLIHCDLCNRNVLVDNDQITGVFDWGCSLYGDHLYDLAWFEFWAPWHAPQDVTALRSALEQRWREVGYTPHNKEARLQACYLHIGLTHLAYNAYLGDWETLAATEERMRTLVDN
jgi:hygromycin-B 4-O-kinase